MNMFSVGKCDTHPPTFISLVLHLYGGKGHELSYQKAVGDAVRLNGWEHVAAISPDPVIKDYPREWRVASVDSGVLDYEGIEIMKLVRRFRFWPFFKSMYKFAVDLSEMLNKEVKAKPNKKIIFLETFNPLQLLSLMFALIFVKRERIAIWLLYRGGPNWGGPQYRLMARSFSFMFWASNPFFELLVGKKNLLLLTDSDVLRLSLPKYYNRPIHLVPIPHTPTLVSEDTVAKRSGKDEIVCWWPGAPRPEKGLEIIRKLTSVKNDRANIIKLVVAKSANLSAVSGGIRVTAIEDKLDREEYDRMFFTSNLILLPYDQGIYNESTSGIFTESIYAGSMPLVTKDTWMAYELSRHGLSDLIIDWDDTGVIETIIRVSGDDCIRGKVHSMQMTYKKYHNVSNFAKVINSLYVNHN